MSSRFISKISLVAGLSLLTLACDSTDLVPPSSGNVPNSIVELQADSSQQFVPNVSAATTCQSNQTYAIQNATSSDDFDGNYNPGRVIDNDLDADSRWSSKGSGRSITLDLGGVRSVHSIQTAWYRADIRQAYFDVETSANNNNWTRVLTGAIAQGGEHLQSFGLSPSDARFVKIIGRGNSDSTWNSLIEAKVSGCNDPDPRPPQNCSNLDSLVIEQATSSGNYDSNYSPAKTIDKNLNTESRWSANGAGRSIVFDLGRMSMVRSLSTAWYKANVRQAFFDVETSADNRNWQVVLSGATATGTQGFIDYDVRETEARYVRIIGQGNSANTWNSLIEVRVQGCGNVDEANDYDNENVNEIENENENGNSDSIALIRSLFDLEGGDNDLNPYRNDDTLVFDALSAKHVTPNGNGWRHELKMAIPNRRAMYDIRESFSATVTPRLSSGSKTIVAQYHASGTGTLVKVYVSDTRESGHADSNPDNGVFDLYVRLRPEGASRETIVDFGAIRSGQSFNLSIENNRGQVTVSAMNTTRTIRVADSDAAYLKFGNYLQAQDPYTGDDVDDKDDWASFYRSAGITQSVVTFTNVEYTTNY